MANREAKKPAAEGAGHSSSASGGGKKRFSINEYVVYPQHGVGQIIGFEEEEIAGCHLQLYVISFEKEKMILRVPSHNVSDLRALTSMSKLSEVLKILEGRARIKRTMWSRRAQQYELKINSGDPTSVAEVVRDLYRSDRQTEQSYSERQLYQVALERLAREVAVVKDLDFEGAVALIESVMDESVSRSRKPAKKADSDANSVESDEDQDTDTDTNEAAAA